MRSSCLSLLTYFITCPCGTLNVPRGGRQKNKRIVRRGGLGVGGGNNIRHTLDKIKKRNVAKKKKKRKKIVLRHRMSSGNGSSNPNRMAAKMLAAQELPGNVCLPQTPSPFLQPQPVAASGRCQRKWKLYQMRHATKRGRERERKGTKVESNYMRHH